MVVERYLTSGGDHIMQCTDDLLLNCTVGTCMVLLAIVNTRVQLKMLFLKKNKKQKDWREKKTQKKR